MKKIHILLILIITISIRGYEIQGQSKPSQTTSVQSLNQEVQTLLSKNAIVIDVRTKEEFQMAHYKDALNIPYDEIEKHIKKLEAYKDKPIILYCRSGRRASIAKQTLEKYGFKNVLNAINLDYFPADKIVR
ncbi:MAG: rhodanese-like domain-containing protein [Leptospiraceae bacterium]|jgi:rhodanese-related sulfurtransferase|nr:rhodanese-like domain-containing protein [Leptospiraceae bacterium]